MQVLVNATERQRARRNEAETWLHNVALKHFADECLLWPFGKFGVGYGAYRKGTAHVAVCRAAHGEPPVMGMEVAHACGNRLCVAPVHLRWATRAENQADRLKHGTDWRGEKHAQAKLTEQQVHAIRQDERGSRAVAADYGVRPRTIRQIRARRTWGWLA
jgi:hypothetical protein